MRKTLVLLTLFLLPQLTAGSGEIFLRMEHQSDLDRNGDGPFMIHEATLRAKTTTAPTNNCVLRLKDSDIASPEYGSAYYSPGAILPSTGSIPEADTTEFDDGNLPWGEKTAQDIYNSLKNSDEGFHGGESVGDELYVHADSRIIGESFSLEGDTICGYSSPNPDSDPQWYMCGLNDREVYVGQSVFTCTGNSWSSTEISDSNNNNNDNEDEGTESSESETEESEEETQQEEPENNQDTETETNTENEETKTCNGEFDAWIVNSTVREYPVEIRGCLTDDLEQINAMLRYDDGVNSYYTATITPDGVNCQSGDCGSSSLDYQETEDQDYNFSLEITDGKTPAEVKAPIEVDADLMALNEVYNGGRAGQTDAQWMTDACISDTYSCVSSPEPYEADLISTVGLETEYEPGNEVTLSDGVTLELPEGCDYRVTYVYQNQPKLKIWSSEETTAERSLSGVGSIETDQGTTFDIDSSNQDEVTFTATCSDWESQENNEESENSEEESGTDVTWINYCWNQDYTPLTEVDNIVECMSSCYGEPKDSSAEGSEGSEELTCGNVVSSFCSSAEAGYDEDSDNARCSQ